MTLDSSGGGSETYRNRCSQQRTAADVFAIRFASLSSRFLFPFIFIAISDYNTLSVTDSS